MIDPHYLMPIAAYLLGSIPVGWIVARVFYNTDIRKSGSGNIGATNALRQFGTLTGIIVLLLDLFKGTLVVMVAKHAFAAGHPLISLCGLLAIMGHVFPVWLGFKGGKGVATAGGVFLALAPVSLLCAIIVFIIVVAFTKYVSLGSILGALAFELCTAYNILRKDSSDFAMLILVSLVVLMIVLKHRANLKRLLDGNENKIHFSKKGAK